MWAGMAISKACETAEEGASSASPIPSTAGAEASGSTPSDSWGGSLYMVVGAWWHLLHGGGAEDMEDCDMAPLRNLYKPSASDPATANCTFYSPSISNHCASPLNTLAHHNKSSPWKRGKESVTKARLSHKIMEEQSERLSDTTPGDIPDLTTPVPPLLPMLAIPPTSTHDLTQPTWYSSLIVTLSSTLPFWGLICKWKQPQMSKGDQTKKSGKQILDLMDQL